MLEEDFYFGVMYVNWQRDDVWAEVGPALFDDAPPFIRPAVMTMVRSGVLKQLWLQVRLLAPVCVTRSPARTLLFANIRFCLLIYCVCWLILFLSAGPTPAASIRALHCEGFTVLESMCMRTYYRSRPVCDFQNVASEPAQLEAA